MYKRIGLVAMTCLTLFSSYCLAVDKVAVVPLLKGSAKNTFQYVPYQFSFSVVSLPGQGENCDSIAVPEGKTLTISSIGIEVKNNPGTYPDVYLRITRSREGGTNFYRFQGDLRRTGGTTLYEYDGIYNVSVTIGQASEGTTYSGDICVGQVGSGETFNHTAQGIVSGYVTDTPIIDGNSL